MRGSPDTPLVTAAATGVGADGMAGETSEKLSWNASFAMAVGGMIGGGIFSVLGIVVARAGSLAWASFVLAGLIALATAHSYAELTRHHGESGGAFTYLLNEGREALAGVLGMVLIAGYVLTMAVYAFTFGHYLAEVTPLGSTLTKVAIVAVVGALAVVNLLGVGSAGGFEIASVWGKLAVLGFIAVMGLVRWEPSTVTPAAGQGLGLGGVVVGAAVVFMAYEAFQLLAYDYEEMDDRDRTVRTAMLAAVAGVLLTYVAVTLGAIMLVGKDALADRAEVALAVAGREAAGSVGAVIASVGAVLSTGSAINATLFATGRLARTMAETRELPDQVGRTNSRGVPDLAITGLAVAAAVLAVVGGLDTLVEAASLAFLATFGIVNVLAVQTGLAHRWASAAGGVAAFGAGGVLIWRLATHHPLALGALGATVVGALLLRAWLQRDR